ncbi:MAG: helix-turn-helix domain-containing protein [Glaciimonas sp.]|nr:helix-turn-helix domain-containing protein [Glaciimonas sp.]
MNKTNTQLRDIYVLIVPGTMLIDLAGISDTFRLAIELGASYAIQHVGPRSQSSCSIGLSLSGIAPLPGRMTEGGTLIVPGATNAEKDYQSSESEVAAKWMASAVTSAQRLCTVCSGAFLAAKAGLLAGRTCTTHHSLTARLASDFPEVSVLHNHVFVRDGNVFTSAGATTGIDLALHIISLDEGPELALEVARKLVIYFRRSGTDPQLSPWLLYRNHIHTAVHRAQDAVIRDSAKSWTVDDLAQVACTSPRHLARLFQTYAGVSPLSYVRQIRTAASKEIVATSQHSMKVVAEMVGFSSAEQMRRAWQQFEGTIPTEGKRSVKATKAEEVE